MMFSAQPTYIVGSSIHSALGKSLAEAIPYLRLPPPQPTKLACKLTGTDTSIPYFLLDGCIYHDMEMRGNHVLNDVVQQAITAAKLSAAQVRRMGLFIGSSSFEIAEEESRFAQALNENPQAHPLAECGMGNFAEKVRERFGLLGPDFSYSTACTSSANALWYAHLAINAGLIDHALVLATEFANDVTTYGFQILQLLSASHMRPFDVNRDGLVLGESCSAVILSKNPSPGSSLSVVGGANICDTHSMSITQEDGTVVAEVIRQALASANLFAEDISAIKCHGTSTSSGDAAEANGMLKVFSTLPPCTVLKPFTGHTLGACGLTELVLFGGVLDEGFLPRTAAIAGSQHIGIDLHKEAALTKSGYYLLNYFGFGGNNTSLVVRHEAASV